MSKLYTEQQVKQMIEKSRETGLTAEYLILTTPPIELPTDEEIENKALNFTEQESYGELNGNLWKGFVFGAKWMRDKIKGS